jgi:hypothetical protein
MSVMKQHAQLTDIRCEVSHCWQAPPHITAACSLGREKRYISGSSSTHIDHGCKLDGVALVGELHALSHEVLCRCRMADHMMPQQSCAAPVFEGSAMLDAYISCPRPA